MRVALCAVGLAVALVGCEDGPKQIFTPFEGDPSAQNGVKPSGSWTQDGSKDFESSAGQGDKDQRARFCDERENETVVQKMVTQPIRPDESLGGVPLWSPTGGPSHANELMGKPSEGRFCDPTVYANALTWGPTDEVIIFINEETKLVESALATLDYLGTMTGKFNDPYDANKELSITVRMKEPLSIGERKLTDYAASAEGSWLNPRNINRIYRMLRQTFFGAANIPTSYDCVAGKLCDIIYTTGNQSEPQTTLLRFQDSGVVLQFSKEGQITALLVEPVRVAPFERSGTLQLVNGGTVLPTFTSTSKAGCTLALDGTVTWEQFTQRCVDDARTLSRATYQTHTQRDGTDIGFNGITFNVMRPVAKGEALKDGERPKGTEKLYGVAFSRTLDAPVKEFVPSALAAAYKQKLEARLRGLVGGDVTHPFYGYTVTIPAGLATTPQRIGELKYTDNGKELSLVTTVLAEVQARYHALTPAQQKPVQAVLSQIFLIEPFVDAVLDAFTNSAASGSNVFKGFRTTNDRRWSLGRVHWRQGGVPVRLEVQYSLNYGAVTSVFVERGTSQFDAVYDKLNTELRPNYPALPPSPYFGLDLAQAAGTPFSLGSQSIKVTGFDRALKTVDVKLPAVTSGGGWTEAELTIPGTHLNDRAGYRRQLRGERWEFVPAHEVYVLGKETWLTLWIEADGALGRVSQGTFKSPMRLCQGPSVGQDLSISYGEDLRTRVDTWARLYPAEYRICEVVFNYSANGNVLDSVASLTNKVVFSTVDGRALSVGIWR